MGEEQYKGAWRWQGTSLGVVAVERCVGIPVHGVHNAGTAPLTAENGITSADHLPDGGVYLARAGLHWMQREDDQEQQTAARRVGDCLMHAAASAPLPPFPPRPPPPAAWIES